MTKKYELTDDTITHWGRTLYRIRALVEIAAIGVQVGDLGGYVEAEKNLAQVSGTAWVSGNAWVFGDARVSGNAWVSGDVRVSGNAEVLERRHLFAIGPVGSENGVLTVCRGKAGILVRRGCFHGTLAEFEAAVNENHADNKYGQEYRLLIELAKLRAAEWEGK